MSKLSFEEFLEEKYDELDNDSNNMNEKFEARRDIWFETLDVQELIDYGQKYGEYVAYETASDIGDKITTQVLKLHDEYKSK